MRSCGCAVLWQRHRRHGKAIVQETTSAASEEHLRRAPPWRCRRSLPPMQAHLNAVTDRHGGALTLLGCDGIDLVGRLPFGKNGIKVGAAPIVSAASARSPVTVTIRALRPCATGFYRSPCFTSQFIGQQYRADDQPPTTSSTRAQRHVARLKARAAEPQDAPAPWTSSSEPARTVSARRCAPSSEPIVSPNAQ